MVDLETATERLFSAIATRLHDNRSRAVAELSFYRLQIALADGMSTTRLKTISDALSSAADIVWKYSERTLDSMERIEEIVSLGGRLVAIQGLLESSVVLKPRRAPFDSIVGYIRGEKLSMGKDFDDVELAFFFGQLIRMSGLNVLSEETRRLVEVTKDADPRDVAALSVDLLGYGDFIRSWMEAELPGPAEKLRQVTGAELADLIDMTTSSEVRSLLSEQAAERIDSIERDAEDSLAKIRRVTAEVGRQGLSGAFLKAKNSANVGAGMWTAGVFVFVAGGIALPLWAFAAERALFEAAPGTAGIILKAAVGLPLFALAAYCGHVSAQHRETARHMAILSAQLNSVQAYSDELPEDQRLELLMLLGKRTFSDPGLVLHDKGKVSYVPDDVIELLKKVTELVGRTQKPNA